MSQPSQTLDPRIARTRQAVQLALVQLLSKDHPFETLTISEVASAADITRKTFYTRFGSLEQVIKDMALDMFSDIASGISDDMLKMPLTDSVLTSVVMHAHMQHKAVLEPLLKYCPGSLFIGPCTQAIDILLDRIISVNRFRSIQTLERQYLVAIVSSTLHATLTVWIERGQIDSPDILAELIVKLLGPGADKLLMSIE